MRTVAVVLLLFAVGCGAGASSVNDSGGTGGAMPDAASDADQASQDAAGGASGDVGSGGTSGEGGAAGTQPDAAMADSRDAMAPDNAPDLLAAFTPSFCAGNDWIGYRLPPNTCVKIKGASVKGNFYALSISSAPGQCTNRNGHFQCVVVGAGASRPDCSLTSTAPYCDHDLPVILVEQAINQGPEWVVKRFDYVNGKCPAKCDPGTEGGLLD